MATLTILMSKLLPDQSIEESEIEVPARWVICGCCDGNGKSSAYLGAITAEEWHRDWDSDEQESYMRGDYDRPCDACGGRGSVLEIARDGDLTAEQRAAIDFQDEEEREAAADRRMAWYESGCPQ